MKDSKMNLKSDAIMKFTSVIKAIELIPEVSTIPKDPFVRD
jgi:hypothetical protein